MLTTRMSPKISVKPLATTKKSAASVIPLSVTTANWRESSLALTISQTITTAATTAIAIRRAFQLEPRSRVVVAAAEASVVDWSAAGAPAAAGSAGD